MNPVENRIVQKLSETFKLYLEDHRSLRLDTTARQTRYTTIKRSITTWDVEAILVDPEELNDWSIKFTVDLAMSRMSNSPEFELKGFGEIGNLA